MQRLIDRRLRDKHNLLTTPTTSRVHRAARRINTTSNKNAALIRINFAAFAAQFYQGNK